MTSERDIRLLSMASVLLLVVPTSVRAQVMIGSEFQVNTYTTGSQSFFASQSMDGGPGGFVVVWGELRGGDTPLRANLFGQRFDSNGVRSGTEFQVNSFTDGVSNYDVSVGVDQSGGFVVAWIRNGDVAARRFASDGTALAAEFQVNTYSAGPGRRYTGIDLDDDGDFVVAWRGSHDGDQTGVFAQRFASDGSFRGTEFQVNVYTTGHQGTWMPQVAMDPDGDFVIVWQSAGQDGDGYGVFGRSWDSSGNPVGGEFQVNQTTVGGQAYPAVTMDGGEFVVVWNTPDQDGDSYAVFGRRMSHGGAGGAEFQVNTYTPGMQVYADVACGSSRCLYARGGEHDGDESMGWGIFSRCEFNGSRDGCNDMQVNTYTTTLQQWPQVAHLGGSRFVVAWASYTQDGSSSGIFARLAEAFTLTPTATPPNTATASPTATMTPTIDPPVKAVPTDFVVPRVRVERMG